MPRCGIRFLCGFSVEDAVIEPSDQAPNSCAYAIFNEWSQKVLPREHSASDMGSLPIFEHQRFPAWLLGTLYWAGSQQRLFCFMPWLRRSREVGAEICLLPNNHYFNSTASLRRCFRRIWGRTIIKIFIMGSRLEQVTSLGQETAASRKRQDSDGQGNRHSQRP